MRKDDIVNGEIYQTAMSKARKARAVSLSDPIPMNAYGGRKYARYLVVMQPLDADDKPVGAMVKIQTRDILGPWTADMQARLEETNAREAQVESTLQRLSEAGVGRYEYGDDDGAAVAVTRIRGQHIATITFHGADAERALQALENWKAFKDTADQAMDNPSRRA